jgi:hypothetical protein
MNGRAIVINCSHPRYNLGAAKLRDWLLREGWDVAADPQSGDPGAFVANHDLVALSVIFPWDAPRAAEIASRVRTHADVWCGGPGVAALGAWWRDQTGGLEIVKGIDQRFDRQRGDYRATFASRGCPVNCSFCIVPRIEGTGFSLDWDFQPAPILCDNNLSALPVEFQEHIIARYRETHVKLLDANSGFEPAAFDEATYERWRGILRGPWRFAFEEQREAAAVQRMMRILSTVRARRKQVWTLVGNEPMADCWERALNVRDWQGEPYCQPLRRLNALSRDEFWVRHDWTPSRLRDFARFHIRRLWRKVPIEDYRPRRNEPPPFRGLLRTPRALHPQRLDEQRSNFELFPAPE